MLCQRLKLVSERSSCFLVAASSASTIFSKCSESCAKPCGERCGSQRDQSRSHSSTASPGQVFRQRPQLGPRQSASFIGWSHSTGAEQSTAVSVARGPSFRGPHLA